MGGLASTGSGATCNPPCTGGKVCSATGTCIDPGTCATNADCTTPGTICDPKTMKCAPGGCASMEIPAMAVPPNLLVVLDRSCSMTDKVGNKTKWDIAVAALDKLTTDYAMKIRFGLTLFPDLVKPNCAQDKIPVPTGPGNEMAIQKLLDASLMQADMYYPKGPCVTNIDTAVQQGAGDPALMDMTRADYMVLLTDGQQAACNAGGGDAGTVMTLQNLANAGVHTFVIGFGSSVSVKALDSFAMAGGEPNKNGPHSYYDASDQMSLDATFAAIASKTIGCVFQLQSPPPDPNQIFAFFDGQSVMRDSKHMNGWDYDAMKDEVIFYGAACDELKQGKVTKVQVVYGCDMLPH